jgi:hypothetical protein
MKTHRPHESEVRDCELLAGELLVTDPERALVALRRLHRLALRIGDTRRAAAALVMMGVGCSRVARPLWALRILRLAARQAPDWYIPQAELAMQHEAIADHAWSAGDLSAAHRAYTCAAELHLKAVALIESSGTGSPEAAAAIREREAWCKMQLARIPSVQGP